jgi:hypothetical protein
MGTARKDLKWTWESPPDDLMAVVRAIEPVVAETLRPFPFIEPGGYYRSGREDISRHNVDRNDLEDALRRLGTPATTVSISYSTSIHAVAVDKKPNYNFQLWTTGFGKSVEIELSASGPDTNETLGLIEQARNRVTGEIARQDKAEWGAIPFPTRPSAGDGTSTSAGISARSAQPQARSSTTSPAETLARTTGNVVEASTGGWRKRVWLWSDHQVVGGLILAGRR